MGTTRVLLVDDEPTVGDLTATYLEQVNDAISVTAVESADAGLDRLETDDVDCVVSDYDMPDADGLQFLDAVRDVEPDLPFVLFTGKGSEEIASEAISAGVTDYLQKGTGTEQYEMLANRIENAVAQHRAEREAERATEQMHRMYRRITDAFYALDEEWNITYVNEKAAEFFERDSSDLVGEDVRNAFPGNVDNEFREAYREAVRTQEPVTVTTESIAQPGRWVEERIYPSDDGLSIYFRDVTEHRRREQTLNALHGATRELMQAETEIGIAEIVCRVADGVLDFPGTGVRLYDPEQETLVSVAIGGEAADEVDGRPTYGVDDTPHGRAYREGETVTFEVDDDAPYDFGPFQRTMYVPLGDHGVLSVGKYEDEPFAESNVRFVEILTENARVALDSTEREREILERERDLERQNERLEEFASVVSHDLRNPLNVARGHSQLARETGDEESFRKVANAHDRMEALIDDLLALAQQGQTVDPTESISIRSVAERAWNTVETADSTLEIADLGRFVADEERLRNLFENLFRNAVEHGSTSSRPSDDDAVERGSTSDQPRADSVHQTTSDAARETASHDALTVRVTGCERGFAVADDGPGIPEAERERVFEHGYSTGDDGIGLGLTIVKSVVEAHGWDVRVEESETGGARFAFEVE